MIDLLAMARNSENHSHARAVVKASAPFAPALFAGLSVAMLTGCYKNVVSVSGPANRNYEVHQANIKPGESVWATETPSIVETERYGTNATTLDRAKPVPSKKKNNDD